MFLIINCNSMILKSFSFSPPFTESDNKIESMISRHWRTSGAAAVSVDFIRLTSSRESSQKAAIWNTKAVMVPYFETVVKFRISGKKEKTIGNGLAIWFTDQENHVDGSLLSISEKNVNKY